MFIDSDEEKKTFAGKRLSQVSMYVALFTLALVGDRQFFVTVSNYFVSNQLIAGSIMVRHMMLIHVLSFAFKSVLPHGVYT